MQVYLTEDERIAMIPILLENVKESQRRLKAVGQISIT